MGLTALYSKNVLAFDVCVIQKNNNRTRDSSGLGVALNGKFLEMF